MTPEKFRTFMRAAIREAIGENEPSAAAPARLELDRPARDLTVFFRGDRWWTLFVETSAEAPSPPDALPTRDPATGFWTLRCREDELAAQLERLWRGSLGYWEAALWGSAENPRHALLASRAPRTGIERAELIAARHASLEEFLADRHSLEQYYWALAEYYESEGFKRAEFDCILGQLRGMLGRVPELSEVLWKPRPDESFVILPEMKSYGREVNALYWWKLRDAWLHELEARIPAWLTPERHVAERDARLAEHSAKLVAKTREFEAGIAGLNKRRQRIERARFYKELARDPILVGIADAALLSHLLWINYTPDSDFLIHRLRNLREYPQETLSRLTYVWYEFPTLLSVIKSRVPSLTQLLRDEKVFRPRKLRSNAGKTAVQGTLRAVPYRFRSVSRKLHAIWRGIPAHDCAGGQNLEWTTPARWAAIALEGAQCWNVERADRNAGLLFSVPFRIGGKSYSSLEICAPVVIHRLSDDDDGGDERLVLDEFLVRTGREMVMSDTNQLNFASLTSFLKTARCYAEGERVGSHADAGFDDPLARRIVEACRAEGYSTRFGRGIILGVTLESARELRRLSGR